MFLEITFTYNITKYKMTVKATKLRDALANEVDYSPSPLIQWYMKETIRTHRFVTLSRAVQAESFTFKLRTSRLFVSLISPLAPTSLQSFRSWTTTVKYQPKLSDHPCRWNYSAWKQQTSNMSGSAEQLKRCKLYAINQPTTLHKV